MAMSSDQILQCPPPIPQPMAMDRRWKANIEPAPNCPRCASPNTKFCYYNNYSLSQPRYFCKGCRRYWTKGGSLRNVPVGGGCRKSRRSRSSKNSFLQGSRDGGSGPHSSSSPNSSSSASSDHESGGPNIDLAAVFAKFLSHDQINQEVNEGITTPSEASHDSLTTSSSCGLEKLSDNDVLDDQEFQVMEELVIVPSDDQYKQLHQEEQEAIQGFISPDLASFDDIITEDVFWSDTSDLSSLTWQPVAQSQEFDSTSLFTSDNWSYFDTTGFEVFPRP